MIELTKLAETEADFAEIDRLTELLRQSPQKKWEASTLSEVAEFFGLAVQTVKQWRIESPPMPGGEGRWPLQEIVRWREAKLKSSDIKAAKLKQDFERGEIDLESKRMELIKEKGELVEVADVERWAAIAITESRERIMALPGMISGSVSQELREMVREETERHCREVLNTLAEKLSKDELLAESSSTL